MIALVVTIIVLLILAGVTISLVIGQNGMIGKADEAKIAQEIAEETDQIQLKIADVVADKLSKGQTVTIEAIKKGLIDSGLATAVDITTGDITTAKGHIITGLLDDYLGKHGEEETDKIGADGANVPKLTAGMTPVKWNGSTWEDTTAEDNSWYNYNNKQWANVRLEDGSMLVWIPRYAYKITSKVHQGGTNAGDIEIAFVNTTNKDKAGTSYSTTYPTVENNAMTDYVVHPAFVNYDGKELSGIWVGKYESSNDGSNNIKIVSGVSSWRNITINDIYHKCVSMKNSGNSYGLTENSDPHILKNTEWGACIYLAQSQIGTEVSINSSTNFITGTGGVAASTTGNETGIYDMSGGAFEYTAAYIDAGSSNSYLTDASYGKALYEAPSKHKDVYKVGNPEGQENNYNANSNKYGDGVWETSNSYGNANSWYSDYSKFPYSTSLFFLRGGYYDDGLDAGLFYFNYYNGGTYNYNSFRVCITAL